MAYFDLHCDTLCECERKNIGLWNNGLHVDLAKIKQFPYIQCCAAWIPDSLRGDAAFEHFKKLYNVLLKQSENGGFTMIRCKADMEKVDADGTIGLIPTIEGGAAIAGKLENIDKIADLGVKMMTLTWNGSNEIGSGIGDDMADYGLTEFGRSAVRRMNDRKIIIDISHASERLFYDVCEHSSEPFVASHSNSKTLCSNRRNLTDTQFAEIVKRKGLVGLNFYKDFLNNESEKACIGSIFEHADYFMSLGGEDVVSFGSDFDGSDIPNDLNGIAGIDDILDVFVKHNYSSQLISKLFYKNARDFMLISY